MRPQSPKKESKWVTTFSSIFQTRYERKWR
jgi:hypothetical protein